MVGCGLVFLTLPTNTGHPDEVGVFLQQVHDVPVGKLGRIARRFRRHGLNTFVVRLCGGLIRQNDREAQPSEERMPERIILVHVERTWNANSAARSRLLWQRFTVKEQLVLERKEVGGLVFLTAFSARALLAAVAGNKAMSAAKIIDRQKTAIGADAAVRIGELNLKVVDCLFIQKR